MEDNTGTAAQDFDITAGLTPMEAAELLGRLDRGQQAAYAAAPERERGAPDQLSRVATATELQNLHLDAAWATIDNGMRQPGESPEAFVARARSEVIQDPARWCATVGHRMFPATHEVTLTVPGDTPEAHRVCADCAEAYTERADLAVLPAASRALDESEMLPPEVVTDAAPEGDLTQAQRDGAAGFSEGYRRGQADAWNGTWEACGSAGAQYGTGYALGHKWGSAHPAPYGRAEPDPVGEQEHETDDAYVCGFPHREDDGSKSRAVIDGISNGSIDPAALDVGLWAARAAETAYPQESSVSDPEGTNPARQHGLFALGQGVVIDDGPTERQLNDWNIANDHAEDGDGLDYDRDYEAG